MHAAAASEAGDSDNVRAYAAARAHDEQNYAQAFFNEMASLSPEQVVARAAMYARAASATFEGARRAESAAPYERRVLGPSEHCADCVEAAARGWQPAGVLPAIGTGACKSNCQCRWEFAKTANFSDGVWHVEDEPRDKRGRWAKGGSHHDLVHTNVEKRVDTANRLEDDPEAHSFAAWLRDYFTVTRTGQKTFKGDAGAFADEFLEVARAWKDHPVGAGPERLRGLGRTGSLDQLVHYASDHVLNPNDYPTDQETSAKEFLRSIGADGYWQGAADFLGMYDEDGRLVDPRDGVIHGTMVEDVFHTALTNFLDEIDNQQAHFGYDPDQPRAPKGASGGGRWVPKNGTHRSQVKRLTRPQRRAQRAQLKQKLRQVWAGASPKIKERIKRLPRAARRAAALAWTLYNGTYHAGNAAARELAKDKGLDEKKASRLGRLLFAGDLAHATVASVPLMADFISPGAGQALLHAAGIDHLAAGIAAFVPAASALYVAYSGVRHPLRAVRAAWKGAAHLVHKVRQSAGFADLAAQLADVLAKLDDKGCERFEAFYAAALDLTGDPSEALRVAEEDARGFTKTADFADGWNEERGPRGARRWRKGTQITYREPGKDKDDDDDGFETEPPVDLADEEVRPVSERLLERLAPFGEKAQALSRREEEIRRRGEELHAQIQAMPADESEPPEPTQSSVIPSLDDFPSYEEWEKAYDEWTAAGRADSEALDAWMSRNSERDKLVNEWLSLDDQTKAVRASRRALADQARGELRNALRREEPMPLDYSFSAGRKVQGLIVSLPLEPNESQKVGIETAVSFVTAITNWGDAPKPKVTFETSPSGRAYFYQGRRGSEIGVGLKAHDSEHHTTSMTHELGHLIEMTKPGTLAKAQAFLAARVGAEEPVDMGTIPGGETMKGEMVRKDSFDRYFDPVSAYYVGKVYSEGTTKGATEVLSMGLEALYRDPAGFAEADPEYAKFVIDCLTDDPEPVPATVNKKKSWWQRLFGS